jgi:hypothetical protein
MNIPGPRAIAKRVSKEVALEDAKAFPRSERSRASERVPAVERRTKFTGTNRCFSLSDLKGYAPAVRYLPGGASCECSGWIAVSSCKSVAIRSWRWRQALCAKRSRGTFPTRNGRVPYTHLSYSLALVTTWEGNLLTGNQE